MKCTECKKRPATLHFTNIINGDKQEIHLCQSCAIKQEESNIEDTYKLHDLLTGLFNFDTNAVNMETIKNKGKIDLVCLNCELSFHNFRQIGKFGCSECYESFESKLNPIFKRVHSGNTKHVGKIPKRTGGVFHQKKELENYRKQLKKLIVEEEFEEAAVIRDTIRKIEKATDGE